MKTRTRTSFAAYVVALAALLVLVPAAFAAKGGGAGGGGGGGGHKGGSGTSSSVALVMVTDQNGNGLPNWNDTITFKISTTATASPYLSVRCYQNSVLVYSADAGFYPSYPWPGAQMMPLYSPSWTGGAATCTAVLNDGLATLNFGVGA